MRGQANCTPSPSKETEALDVKPLRCLAPMAPAPFGFTTYSPPGGPPFISITPIDPFHSSSQQSGSPAGFSPSFPSPEYGRPATMSSSGRKLKRPAHLSRYQTRSSAMDGSDKKKEKRKRFIKPGDLDLMMLTSSSEDPREAVEVILTTFDALRRRLLQLEEASNGLKRPDLKAGAVMMDIDLRVNKTKRIGPVPGVHVGDIFYFRMEMCLVGLHAQSMGGIDYISTKFGNEDETLAVGIVSSGGYEDESDDVDVLIYSGQGGSKWNDHTKQLDDQKLERGNLALQRSLNRANEIRVIRGTKDPSTPGGKIYIYDGLYKINESWTERGKSGFNLFKYKLLRDPGQPEAFAIWKMSEKWRENPSARGRVILPDMSSGEEALPVCLVNEVDTEKGPSLFTYAAKVKYLTPLDSTEPFQGCMCQNVCLPGDGNCSCAQQNGGDLPYGSSGLLVTRKPVIYECSSSCQCSANCRNRVSQKGIRLHFEVFRTRDRGWGLRSWDSIRAGTFICEYTGAVTDKAKVDDDGEDEYIFDASHSDEKAFKWNYGPELIGEPSACYSGETFKSLPISISAKYLGNVSRFMNHSCSPNVFWQPVQLDHSDEGYPHIMFFAMKHIPPMTELTYDYGQSGRKSKECLCGSLKCRGFFG